MWSEISVWFEFAFLCWLMIFSSFSCTYWPYICLLWKYLSCFLILCFFLSCFVFWTRILTKWLIVPSLKYTGCFNSRFLRFGYGSFRDLMSKSVVYHANDNLSFSLGTGAVLFATGPLLKVVKSQGHHIMHISLRHFVPSVILFL